MDSDFDVVFGTQRFHLTNSDVMERRDVIRGEVGVKVNIMKSVGRSPVDGVL